MKWYQGEWLYDRRILMLMDSQQAAQAAFGCNTGTDLAEDTLRVAGFGWKQL